MLQADPVLCTKPQSRAPEYIAYIGVYAFMCKSNVHFIPSNLPILSVHCIISILGFIWIGEW